MFFTVLSYCCAPIFGAYNMYETLKIRLKLKDKNGFKSMSSYKAIENKVKCHL
jgi:hypothetical protein